MRAESSRMNVRELLRLVFQELDVASACVEEIRFSVRAQEMPQATEAATSLYRSWARAERAIASFERIHVGGGASEAFARDALRASSRAGATAVAELLATARDAAARFQA